MTIQGRAEARPREAFACTADPSAYVPRTATEAALLYLEDGLCAAERIVALCGPSGCGKTLLTHVLALRLGGEMRALHLPYSRLGAEDLWRWTLSGLGESVDQDAAAHLRARLLREREAGESPLLLVVDDAHSLPAGTARGLDGMRAALGQALRLLLVLPEGDPTALEQELGGPVDAVHLEGGMSLPETEVYVRERLARGASEPASRARLIAALPQLHALTEGNPGRLHAEAERILHPLDPDRMLRGVDRDQPR